MSIKKSLSRRTCFLETANLDGETNLKLREATEVTQKMIARGDEFSKTDLAALSLEVKRDGSFRATIRACIEKASR